MIKFLLCILFVTCVTSFELKQEVENSSQESERQTDGPISANLNEYIDNVLPAITNFMINNGLDPMTLPDQTEGFSVRPLFITYHGELELTNGVLTNLRSLKRAGDTEVIYWNKLLRIKADFGMDNIRFDYDYLAKIMNIGPTGGVIGKVKKMSVYADIMLDFNNFEIQLQDFYIHDVGKITVKLTGNILTDFLSNAIIDVITTLFKGILLSIVESNMRDSIQEQINLINQSLHPKVTRHLNAKGDLVSNINLDSLCDLCLAELVYTAGESVIDPLRIPKIHQNIDLQVTDVPGEIEVTNGVIFNLKTLKRAGEALLTYCNDKVTLKAAFGTTKIKFSLNYSAIFASMKIKGGAKGKVQTLNIAIELMANLKTLKFALTQFNIYNVGDIALKLKKSNNDTDVITSTVLNSLTSVFKSAILKVLEDAAKSKINEQLNKINNATNQINHIKFDNRLFKPHIHNSTKPAEMLKHLMKLLNIHLWSMPTSESKKNKKSTLKT